MVNSDNGKAAYGESYKAGDHENDVHLCIVLRIFVGLWAE